MARVDPQFDVIDMRSYTPSRPEPRPKSRRWREDTPRQRALWEKIKNEVFAEVEGMPTPVSDAVGPVKIGKTPPYAVWGDAKGKLGTTYGWKEMAGDYLNRVAALPAGANWDGGYGLNAFSALKTLEKQLSFFKANGKTPLEAASDRFDQIVAEEDRYARVKTGDVLGLSNSKAADKEVDLLKFPSREEELKGLFGGKMRSKTRKGSKKSRVGRKSKKTRKH